jgi:hypothetical protein
MEDGGGARVPLIPTHRQHSLDIPHLLSFQYPFFTYFMRDVRIVYTKGQQYRKIAGLSEYAED